CARSRDGYYRAMDYW
nr:immunoglobulin heavy chain junction region [Mus musculus]